MDKRDGGWRAAWVNDVSGVVFWVFFRGEGQWDSIILSLQGRTVIPEVAGMTVAGTWTQEMAAGTRLVNDLSRNLSYS